MKNLPIVVTILLCFDVPLALRAEKPSDDDPIRVLNSAFRQAYAQGRAATLENSGPILLVRGNALTLIDGDQRSQGSTVDQAYHDLKTVAHVPLTIYSLFATCSDGKIDEQLAAQLRKTKALINVAHAAFDGRLSDEELERRQRTMLKLCKDYIDQVLESGQFSRSKLLRLTSNCVPQIQENLEVTAKYRVDNYHQQMRKWKKSLSDEQWKNLLILIPGSPLVRKDSLAVQYFAHLFGERGEGSRIVYAESLFAESQAMNRLGTHLFDTQIGVDFFGDPWRMHRDVLGTATAKYLETLKH